MSASAGEAPFEILEHTADIGVRATGASREEAFRNACLGLLELIGGRSRQAQREETVRVEASDIEGLLVALCDELIYLAETRPEGVAEVRVQFEDSTALRASLSLGPRTPSDEAIELKAATYHRVLVESGTADGRPGCTSMSDRVIEPERMDAFVWRIPQEAVRGMRVPGIVFATDDLLRQAVQDRALEQVANVATLPGIVEASYAMPDVHWGYGFPIGGVAATEVEAGGVVSPGGVGFDICCGVRLLRSDLSWEGDVRPRIRELVRALGRSVPRGTGGTGRLPVSGHDLEGVLADGVGYPLSVGIGVEEDAELCEDRGVMDAARPELVSSRARERGGPQLGSLGGGNHFLEVQVVEEVQDPAAAAAMRLAEGQVCVMLHSGSRGLGLQVCTDHLKEVDAVSRQLGIAAPDRQLASVPVEHETGRRYLGAMAAAANFGRANRHVLGHAIREGFTEVFGGRTAGPEPPLGLSLVYDVSHNLAKLEEYDVDGRVRLLCVHRKGATRALGPGHLELPDRYREIGQPVTIPGSMGTASYVLVGTQDAARRSFSSTCHGAGRAMSRTKAKKVMSGRDLVRQLEARVWRWPPRGPLCLPKRPRTRTKTCPKW